VDGYFMFVARSLHPTGAQDQQKQNGPHAAENSTTVTSQPHSGIDMFQKAFFSAA